MINKVLIINGNTDVNGLSTALVNAYENGVQNAEVRTIHLHELAFDVQLRQGYKKVQELEPDLEDAITQIKWCDHMVWIHPIWWYGFPALMKGFIDRTFLPGVTFKFEEGKVFPNQLLKGKTARIITTGDSPEWYYRWVMKQPATHQLKKGTLEFCGVKPVKTTFFGSVNKSTPEIRAKWLDKVTALAARETKG
ncbi:MULTISPECIES: NAD(P)H-dependent oxidoreductase [Reichenbachiella]|uniref:Putative NADPH-quinone reductase (Modulator of drug activity B) n=1 Tax=Reichenbachiella agariperforans TaxID=156994 RepID=A0A1M6J4A4_REIAG|nr:MULTISPECIES: NAD(P)H-dependent oxidoreductase [Reichenbachiella]SHJ41536.1 Putative NADPH-quinone reductase (modulator of drug activity B) [Reichenbachiella agariperforans]